MDAVGEVDGRRALRERYDVARRGENEDLVGEKVYFEGAEKLLRLGRLLLYLQKLPDPSELGVNGRLPENAALIFPVGRYAELGGVMHIPSPDLNLERDALLAYDGGVEGLIHILLRGRNIVLETPGDGLEKVVDYA